jgi:hypothetical protein
MKNEGDSTTMPKRLRAIPASIYLELRAVSLDRLKGARGPGRDQPKGCLYPALEALHVHRDMPMSVIRDLQAYRRAFREPAIVPMLAAVSVLFEVPAVEQADICRTAREGDLHYIAGVPESQVRVDEFRHPYLQTRPVEPAHRISLAGIQTDYGGCEGWTGWAGSLITLGSDV